MNDAQNDFWIVNRKIGYLYGMLSVYVTSPRITEEAQSTYDEISAALGRLSPVIANVPTSEDATSKVVAEWRHFMGDTTPTRSR